VVQPLWHCGTAGGVFLGWREMKEKLLEIGGWLLLASLAIETRWKRNQVMELLSRNQHLSSNQPYKEEIQINDPTVVSSNDNKPVII
jgi:hypothetical protein